MSELIVTLNADMIPAVRREEAEVIVRSYFPRIFTLRFKYMESNWPVAILKFPAGAFGSLGEWSEALATRPGKIEDAGEVVKPHVEAELMEMLAARKRPQPGAVSRGSVRRFLSSRRNAK